MKRRGLYGILLLSVLVAGVLPAAEPGDSAARRKQSQAAMGAGNYKDAYEGFRKLVLDCQDDPRLAGNDLAAAIQCLGKLNREEEIDALVEDAVKIHQDNWRLPYNAAECYSHADHSGWVLAGKFYRSGYRKDGQWVYCDDRDRVRTLQLMTEALPLALKDKNRAEVSDYLFAFATMLLGSRRDTDAWRLQYLTELNILPDYGDRHRPDDHGGIRSASTASRSSIRSPRRSNQRRMTASDGAGASKRRPRSVPKNATGRGWSSRNSCRNNSAWRRSARREMMTWTRWPVPMTTRSAPWTKTKPSLGSPRASSVSSCPTSLTSSRFIGTLRKATPGATPRGPASVRT